MPSEADSTLSNTNLPMNYLHWCKANSISYKQPFKTSHGIGITTSLNLSLAIQLTITKRWQDSLSQVKAKRKRSAKIRTLAGTVAAIATVYLAVIAVAAMDAKVPMVDVADVMAVVAAIAAVVIVVIAVDSHLLLPQTINRR